MTRVRKVLSFEARSSPIFSRTMFVKNDNSWVFWPGLTDHEHNHAKWEEIENSYCWNLLLVFERPDRCILEKWNCRSSFWLDWKLPLSKLFFEHHEVYKKEQGHNNFSILKLSLVFFLLFNFFNLINMKKKFRKQKTCFQIVFFVIYLNFLCFVFGKVEKPEAWFKVCLSLLLCFCLKLLLQWKQAKGGSKSLF